MSALHQLVTDGDGSTPLHVAAAAGDLEKVRHLLAAGMTANLQDRHGSTPIHLALMNRKETTADILIDAVDDYDIQDGEKRTPLHLAVQFQCIGTVRKLLAVGANTCLQDRNGRTPLHGALVWDRRDEIEAFLNTGIVNDIGDSQGRTLLHIAVEYRNCVDVIRKLLATGVHVRLQDSTGRTPLHIALTYRKESVAEVLMDMDNNFDLQDTNGRTPLHIAVAYGCVDAIKRLVAKGANTHIQDANGWTPLHTALAYQKRIEAEVLLDASGKHDVLDKKGRSLLHYAAKYGHVGIARKLYAADACLDTRLQDHRGRTPLHRSLNSDQMDVTEFLVDVDGLNEVPDAEGITPLHIAVRKELEGVVKKMLYSGVNPHIKDNSGYYILRNILRNEPILKTFIAMYAWRGTEVEVSEIRVVPAEVQKCLDKEGECRDEIRLMGDTKVGETGLSYLDFARASVRKAAVYLENEGIRDVLLADPPMSDFPRYGELIAFKTRQAEEMRILMAKCVDCFGVLSRNLPSLVRISIDIILSCLSERDMRNFVTAFQWSRFDL